MAASELDPCVTRAAFAAAVTAFTERTSAMMHTGDVAMPRGKPPRLLKLRGAVPRFVWTASEEGRLLYCNADLRNLLGDCEGCAIEELMQSRLVHADDRSRWLEAWRRAVSTGESYEVEYRAQTDSGSAPHWYLERGAQCECRGRSDRWFITATQIDAQKHREQKLVLALHHKERFLATLLHELRNPLAPIANAMEALAARPDDPHMVSGACGVIQRQLRQLTLLVDDLLDVSRMDRGAIRMHKEWIDLVDVIHASVETAAPITQSRTHEVTIATPEAPVRLHADAVRLRQVVTNVLINAAKYTEPAGNIHIHVGVEGEEAVIRIRDNGVGISAELLPRIFEPFTQAAPGSHAAMGGLGVGLAVARELVHLHSGTIHAFSEGLGCGSEFVICLPMRKQTDEDKAPSRRARDSAHDP